MYTPQKNSSWNTNITIYIYIYVYIYPTYIHINIFHHIPPYCTSFHQIGHQQHINFPPPKNGPTSQSLVRHHPETRCPPLFRPSFKLKSLENSGRRMVGWRWMVDSSTAMIVDTPKECLKSSTDKPAWKFPRQGGLPFALQGPIFYRKARHVLRGLPVKKQSHVTKHRPCHSKWQAKFTKYCPCHEKWRAKITWSVYSNTRGNAISCKTQWDYRDPVWQQKSWNIRVQFAADPTMIRP